MMRSARCLSFVCERLLPPAERSPEGNTSRRLLTLVTGLVGPGSSGNRARGSPVATPFRRSNERCRYRQHGLGTLWLESSRGGASDCELTGRPRRTIGSPRNYASVRRRRSDISMEGSNMRRGRTSNERDPQLPLPRHHNMCDSGAIVDHPG